MLVIEYWIVVNVGPVIVCQWVTIGFCTVNVYQVWKIFLFMICSHRLLVLVVFDGRVAIICLLVQTKLVIYGSWL